MPLIETRGTASSRAFGQFAQRAIDANYIEDVFSTWLYTGNSSSSTSQTITNGINLSGKGGMVWVKRRVGMTDHCLFDTSRGVKSFVSTNTALAQQTYSNGGVTAFSTTGFTMGPDFNTGNNNGENYASWTFREQAKFFDVVTYTGNGVAGRAISHNLGSVPGFIMVKALASNDPFVAWHRSKGNGYAYLNSTSSFSSAGEFFWGNGVTYTAPTSSTFTVSDALAVNASGAGFVAYIFAHDAGGFGASGTDNVISCGSYTGNGSATGPTVTLGYEPQWLLIKNGSFSGSWQMMDVMRGMPVGSADATVQADTTAAESSVDYVSPTSTGFQLTSSNSQVNGNSQTYYYIAIRRGPMRTPTSGTSVFISNAYTGTATTTDYDVGLVGDLSIVKRRTTSGEYTLAFDRLRGDSLTLALNRDWADTANSSFGAGRLFPAFSSSGKQTVYQYRTSDTAWNASGVSYIDWFFKRAPGFFDVLCYTGDGNSDRSVPHNLSVKPELILVKQRDISVNGYSFGWFIYSKSIPNPDERHLNFNSSGYVFRGPYGVKLSTTNATNLVVNGGYEVNEVSKRYVAYLFASCAGVSSVGSYTGTGTTQQINCGFTGGARFVLIKRIDPGSPYDWYVWDTARGIVAGNDPYLLLNNSDAEVTSTDYIDTLSTGFEISSTAPAAINGSGGTFIYLAIA